VSRLLFLYADVIPDGRRQRAARWLQTCNSNDQFDERRLGQLVRQNMRDNNVYVGLPAGHRYATVTCTDTSRKAGLTNN